MRKKYVLILLLVTVSGCFPITGILNVSGQEEENRQFVYGRRTGQVWPFMDPDIGESAMPYDICYWSFESLYWTEKWTTGGQQSVIPWLVEEEVVYNDNTMVNLTLREGIKFWNGQPLNASVVEWNFDRWNLLGATIWSEHGFTGANSWIQRAWYDLDTFLAIGDNIKYNDSVAYPHLTWNDDSIGYLPAEMDGTNTSAMAAVSGNPDDLQWPRDWRNWTGRSGWHYTEVWDPTTNDTRMAIGSVTGDKRWANPLVSNGACMPAGEEFRGNIGQKHYKVAPDNPLKFMINLSLPIWNDVKFKMLERMPIKYPDGSWNETTQFWNYDGPMLYPGDMYPAAYSGQLEDPEEALAVVGTGMFIPDTIDRIGEIWTFKKNPDYWGGNWEDSGRLEPIDPDIDTFVIKNYQDEAPYYTAELAGELDWILNEGPSAPDYWPQIEDDPDLTLIGPFGSLSSQYFPIKKTEYLDPQHEADLAQFGVNFTIRHAMSFAFDYYDYINATSLGNAVRNPGPGSAGLLYTNYPNGNQRIFPGQVDEFGDPVNGYHYNITEARRILLDSGAADGRGLTPESLDQAWLDVASGSNPIESISVQGFTSNPAAFTSWNTYMRLIGLNVSQYGPVADADVYPYEMCCNRWQKTVMYNDMNYATPHWFDPYKWFWDDEVTVDVFDPDDHNLNWNSIGIESSLVELTDDDLYYVRVQLGDANYEPSYRNLRDLMYSLPFQLEVSSPNYTQLQYDIDTLLDYIYVGAYAIWTTSYASRRTLKTSKWAIPEWWSPAVGGGGGIWDFEYIAGEPEVPIIPGFQFVFGATMIAIAASLLVIKRKRKAIVV